MLDQTKRPPMLNRLNRPTKPAAAAAPTAAPLPTDWTENSSCIITEAWPSTPMPAVTLRQSIQKSR